MSKNSKANTKMGIAASQQKQEKPVQQEEESSEEPEYEVQKVSDASSRDSGY